MYQLMEILERNAEEQEVVAVQKAVRRRGYRTRSSVKTGIVRVVVFLYSLN